MTTIGSGGLLQSDGTLIALPPLRSANELFGQISAGRRVGATPIGADALAKLGVYWRITDYDLGSLLNLPP